MKALPILPPLTVCPTCRQPMTAWHFRDTGDATEVPDGACPVLFARRNRNRVSS